MGAIATSTMRRSPPRRGRRGQKGGDPRLDYHHGNGSQDIFYARSDVLFVSIPADPCSDYPFYWGHDDESGEGEGEGATLNLPLPRGSGREAYDQALDTALARIKSFGPDLLVCSYGADTFTG